ncbi:MAG TPA: hypothetical protein PKA90_04870 [Ignavibacteria bacterium]|nr:hypothetical protein [Ignavibacteria bacterium]HMR39741.1 hypothetical protein [Ignavibacteria bacterium]
MLKKKANLDAMNIAAARLLEIGHIPLIGMNTVLPVIEKSDIADKYKTVKEISQAVINSSALYQETIPESEKKPNR